MIDAQHVFMYWWHHESSPRLVMEVLESLTKPWEIIINESFFFLVSSLSAYAEYILMEPSEVYKPFIQQMKVKVHLTKIVIEFLTNNLEASYEDLLNRVQV